jgi:hypothetical protein
MSDPTQPPEEETTSVQGYESGRLITFPLPDEVAVPLRKDQFDTLCEGGVADARASRDLYLGFFFGALVGLVGILATTDDTVWNPERRGGFLFWLLFLVVIVSGSAVGAGICWVRLWRTRTNSPFSRLRDRLVALFEAQQTH